MKEYCCKGCIASDVQKFYKNNRNWCKKCLTIKYRESTRIYAAKHVAQTTARLVERSTNPKQCRLCPENNLTKFSKFNFHYCTKCMSIKQLSIKHLELKQGNYTKFFKRILSGAKIRSLSKSMEFNLTVEWLENKRKEQNNKCYYTGIEFNPFKRKHTLSMDRLDSTKGYTTDNVVLCIWIVNSMKNNSSLEDFKDMIKILYFNYVVRPPLETIRSLPRTTLV